MIIFLTLTFALLLPGIKLFGAKSFNETYISKQQTTCINGFFTLLVFLSHVSTYIKLDSSLDAPYTAFKSYMLQAIVATFLFYSGYGIMESIKKGGADYVKSIPKKRFLMVLLHLDLAVLLFLIVNFAFGTTFSVKRILLSLVGYNSVGNSNWYIFAILGLYLIVFVSFIFARKHHAVGVALSTLLSIGFVYFQFILKRDSWCYDTIILFPSGMIFSLLKPTIDDLVRKNKLLYPAMLIIALASYGFFYSKRAYDFAFYSMWIILFMTLIVLLTMKIKIGNKVLEFFGSHVFSIYILQRIPMIIFKNLGLAKANKYVFVIVCFAVTLVLSVLFDKFTKKIDRVLFKKIKKS